MTDPNRHVAVIALALVVALMLVVTLGPAAESGRAQKTSPQPPPSPSKATSGASASPADEKQLVELLQQADAALKKEDYASASGILESYLAKNPQDYSVKF